MKNYARGYSDTLSMCFAVGKTYNLKFSGNYMHQLQLH
jgi:hypothetical protein